MAVVVVQRCDGFTLLGSGGCRNTGAMGEQAPPVVYKRYICSFPGCNATYNKNWKLQAHLCKHTGERPFPCTYEGCGKGFITAYHLRRHSLTHTGEKTCKCEAEGCDMAFTTVSNMKKHVKRAHSSASQVYVCYFTDCAKVFKKQNQLKVHQYIHTNQQPFQCTHEGCDKCFSSPSRLKRHEKVHAGYPCRKDDACTFLGSTWTEYLKHVAEVHTEPAVCDVCNRNFKNKSWLKDHRKIHDNERLLYSCPKEACSRTYTTKFGLQSHILAFHEDHRPFVCEHPGCGKAFPFKISLNRHANTHDPEKKKMPKPPRPTRSLASRLSGYKPKKSKKKKSSDKPALDSVPPNPSQVDSDLRRMDQLNIN